MKDFIKTFLIVAILLFVFLFFGGYLLFDFSKHFWLAALNCAFIASIIIYVLCKQAEKIEELEKRIKDIEEAKNGAD